MTRVTVLLTSLVVAGAWDDSGFFGWFADELREATDVPLVFDGKVPSYLAGSTFVQTGPARFGFGKMHFTHMLDGYSKTNTLKFAKDGNVTYTTKFLASGFLNASIKKDGIARGMFVGDIEPPPHWGPTQVLGHNDNNYIKMRRVGDQNMLLADTLIATKCFGDYVSFDENIRSKMMKVNVPGVDWTDSLEPLGDLCILGTMAHAYEDPATGVHTGAMGCLGASGTYHIVFEIAPSAPSHRKLLAKIPLPSGRGPSYMHSLGGTPNYIVLIADPLYMDMAKVMEGFSLGGGSLITNNDDVTLFQVVNRKTGVVRTLEAPGFIYGHVFNTWEEGGDILLDLTYFDAGNTTSLGWMNRWFLKYMKDPSIRESWPRAQAMRYRLKADGKVEQTLLFQEEKGENDFETPKINEKLNGHPYCIVYMMQFHSYEYDVDQSSMKGGPMGAVGIAKRNLCTGERMGFYEPNTYPSEVEFVANPAGSAEDDGVLLSMVYDGRTNSSFFQILDARTMKRIAKTTLPIKAPFLIHASIFPETSPVEGIIV